MNRRHHDRVAVVSGAAKGIGQAYAQRLAADGCDVAILDVDEDTAETGRMVAQAGRAALAVRCDVSLPDDVERARSVVIERFGRADILVNNAGIYPFKPFAELDFDGWRHMLAVDLDSLFLMTKAFTPGMVERGWGRVINQSSSTFGMVVPNATHYVAAKMGVIGFTRALASELGAHGVTVNAIAPGATRTPGMVDAWGPEIPVIAMAIAGQAIKRGEEPADLAGALSFLASEDAAFITGQTLVVDGGMVRV